MDVEMKKNTHLSNISCTHCGFSTKKGDVRQRRFERYLCTHTHTHAFYMRMRNTINKKYNTR